MAASTVILVGCLISSAPGRPIDLSLGDFTLSAPTADAPLVSSPDRRDFDDEDSDLSADPWIVGGTTAIVIGAIAAWGWAAWWSDGFEAFSFRDTGFFGRDTYAGGSDKVGHMYANYVGTLATTRLYQELGLNHTSAVLMAAGAATFVSNGVELADAFTEFGFEYGDAIANTLGIGFAVAAELSPTFHSIAGMRMAYVPSRDILSTERTFIKWLNDYSGMLFYLDIKGKGVWQALGKDPGIARYLTTGVVWGSDRYSPVRINSVKRRQFGVHVGLSLPELLRSGYPDDDGVEVFATFFDYYAAPFLSVAALTDLNTGEWSINFGVANRAEFGL